MISPEEAMAQATATADIYAKAGMEKAKQVFGEHIADTNPAALATFLAGYMQTASIDYGCTLIGIKIDDAVESYCGLVRDLPEGGMG